MLRNITLALIAATALAACATTAVDNAKTGAVSPNATSVEILPPEPVMAAKTVGTKMADNMAGHNTDVMGNKLMTSAKTSPASAPAKVQVQAAPEAAVATLENLYYVAQTKWEMVKFIEAVNAANLAAALEADGAMTVFAPTTEAFERAGDTAATADLLKGHIVSGKLTAADITARAAAGNTKLPTLAGTELTIYVMGETVKIADPGGRLYTVTQADAEASNGVLHMINGVFAGK